MQQGMERWVCRSGNFAKAVCSDTGFSRQLHFPPSLATLQRAASARQSAAVEETCIRAPDRIKIISQRLRSSVACLVRLRILNSCKGQITCT